MSSGLDVTPMAPAGGQVIQSYGGGRFRIAGELHEGHVMIFAERTLAWSPADPEMLSITDFDAVATAADSPKILIVGCGARFEAPPKGLRQELKARGLVLEWMDTRAACRTFNVLLMESRPVAATIIAID